MSKSLVILAAGIGSRYGGLKQMDPMGPSGEFIIDYSIYDAIRAGFDKVVFLITHAIEDDFRATIGGRIEEHVETSYAYQEISALPSGFEAPAERRKPWGTGHALLACRQVVDTPFAVINADDYYGSGSYSELGRFLDETALETTRHAMVGFTLRNTVSEHGHVARGVCHADDSGCLVDVVERTHIVKTEESIQFKDETDSWHALSGEEIVSMNLWGFKPSIFSHLDAQFSEFLAACIEDPKAEFFIPSVVNSVIRKSLASVQVLQTPSEWFGVTYAQDKEPVVQKIRALVAAGVYPKDLWA